MMNKKITIIGTGNMGQAIAHSLLQKKVIKPQNLILTDIQSTKLLKFVKLNVTVEKNNRKACDKSDIIILAIKPQALVGVLKEIKESINQKQLIISIAAGISINSIKNILGKRQPVSRIMPNLCAQIGESMSGWTKSRDVNQVQTKLIKIILNSIGKEIFVKDEDDIDKITAISGSGPAYVFYLAELLENSAIKLGIPSKDAQILARHTLIGSAGLLKVSKDSAKIYRNKVTSKGGTTEAAFKKIKNSDLEQVFYKAIKAAYIRAKELKIN